MSRFDHQRHKPPTQLLRKRTLVVACPQLRSNINFSRIVRAASCFAAEKVLSCGNAKVDPKIARDGAENLCIETRRSLNAPLGKLKIQGYRLIGLEQTSGSTNLPDFKFERHTVLVVGHERNGIDPSILEMLDDAVEIPVYGMPHSFNVATATAIAIYEYCRQFPEG